MSVPVVSVTPEVFEFSQSLEISQSATIKLKNNSKVDPIIFKVKTTMPKNYSVRPNSGGLNPLEEITLRISWKPPQPLPTSSKHIFLIQYLVAMPDANIKWESIGSKDIHIKQFSVNFGEGNVNKSETVETELSETPQENIVRPEESRPLFPPENSVRPENPKPLLKNEHVLLLCLIAFILGAYLS